MIEPFVDIGWVREHRDEVVLADCRWYLDGGSGRAAYEAGHIPTAVFVDLDAALTRPADPVAAGRHPLAEPAAFAAAMGELGIGDEDVVIGYDDAAGVIAARLVWMLRATGREAALLDGGLAAWRGELEVDPALGAVDLRPGHRAKGRPPREAASFTARPWPAERLATIEETASAAQGGAVVIDARPVDRFTGGPDELDPRAGHIPGDGAGGARPRPPLPRLSVSI